MNRQQKTDSLAGYALAAAIGVAALIIVSLIGMSVADAGGFRQATCGHHVVQQAAVVAAVPYPAVIGYQVGQHMQQQAVDEHGFRSSPSQARLTFLEGYFQAQQERLTDSGDRPTGPSRPASGHPAATEGGQTCDECQVADSATSEPQAFSAPQAPSLADVAANEIGNSARGPMSEVGNSLLYEEHRKGMPSAFATTHPTLTAACSACHVDEQSKGGFGIAKAVTWAKAEADCETILAMVDSIATGAMPKGNPLSDSERLAAIAELLSK